LVTAGTAEYLGRERSADEAWTAAAFLKATADDLSAPPHALDYIPLRISGELTLVHLRSFITAHHEDGAAWVVGGTRIGSYKLPVGPIVSPPSSRARELRMCLGIRVPEDDRWSIWKTASCTAEQALEHAVVWSGFRSWLGGSSLDESAAEQAARVALHAHGIEVGPTSHHFETVAVGRSSLSRYARALLARMRLGIERES